MCSLRHSWTQPSKAPLTELLSPGRSGAGGRWAPDLASKWSKVSSPNLPSLWEQLFNAGTHLDPGLTAKLDANYSLDVLFFLTPQWELLPVALLRCCWRRFSCGSGSVWLTQTISFHTLWARFAWLNPESFLWNDTFHKYDWKLLSYFNMFCLDLQQWN